MRYLELVSLFLLGLLAGEEFVVRYGVHGAMAVLDERGQVLARQGLITRLKVLVPSIMVPAVLTGAAVTILGGTGAGFGFRLAGAAVLLAFVLFTFLGTVPINQRIGDWDADAPPADWRAEFRRWERIDVFRSSAAILAFALFLLAVGVRVA
ncbi:DUF1772 domain-containing protein [Umezawaea sp. Da 62-37]|uniref:DUF1772 domain-containing protein n=1 Tax=Umezawaea sp. Da 62-37 TaxID=3075927 RepID=UPI0028F6D400|nr:DUF1772 domain-containing protein [Umezawaea sp. Da 62-37]WNV88930.1 DUF1772 domain-containing protein [Umezawaea sp. Da 62-37]